MMKSREQGIGNREQGRTKGTLKESNGYEETSLRG